MQKKGVRLVFEMIAVKPPGDPNHSMHNPGYRSLHYGNQSLQQQLPRASYSRFACPAAAKPVCCQAGYCFERLVYQQRCHPCSIPGLRRYNLFGDYSYGMYIYAFPVEQIVATTLQPTSPWVTIAISFPATLALAVFSWTWIEAPALANRHVLAALWRLRRLRETPAAPTP